MERAKIESNNINSVGYEDSTNTLEVEFSSGLIYQYKDVPSYVAFELITSESSGRYLHKKIKNNYECKKVS